MIADPVTGSRVRFIPLRLQEGEESDPVTLSIDPETVDPIFKAPADDRVTIMGRIAPGAYQDLAADPLDLPDGATDVDVKVIAADPLPGVNRVYISAYVPRNAAAAWHG